MSFLHLPSINMADFSRGTISLWFRFSDDSVINAIKHGNSYPPPQGEVPAPEILKYTIPLITFGRRVMAHCYGSESRIVGLYPTGVPFYAPAPVDLGDQPCPPSHIGIDPGEVNKLIMFFQTETRAQVQGLVHQTVAVEFRQRNPGEPYQQYTTVTDISYIRTAQPESFLINPKFEISEDKWHHLLLSFDFSHSIDVAAIAGDANAAQPGDSIRGYCKFWYAFDDENKSGKDNMGDAWAYKEPNDVVTQTAKVADFTYFPHPPSDFVTGGTENPEYHWTASPVPMNSSAVGLPASAEYVNNVYHCEMAELQFFGDLVLDTSNINNRRAFVDADGTPVAPDQTEKLLGRRPDILLHGTGDWQTGNNTGSTGALRMTEGDDVVIPAGQFTPLGSIKTFEPDPSLQEETA
jgi:hypothetical protein